MHFPPVSPRSPSTRSFIVPSGNSKWINYQFDLLPRSINPYDISPRYIPFCSHAMKTNYGIHTIVIIQQLQQQNVPYWFSDPQNRRSKRSRASVDLYLYFSIYFPSSLQLRHSVRSTHNIVCTKSTSN